MTASGPSAARGLRGDAAQLGERGLAVDAAGVVARGDQELAGDLDSDAMQLDEGWRDADHQCLDLAIQ